MTTESSSRKEKCNAFFTSVDKAVQEFGKIPKNKNIRVISHLDADGISAASILVRALSREKRPYSISILHNLDKASAKVLGNEDYGCYFFADIGSGQLELIKRYLKGKKIFILDHHKPVSLHPDKDVIHINPHLFGIDGTKNISGSGVVYFFAKALNNKNVDMAHIGIVGAIGDIQERNGFSYLNNLMLTDAIASKNMEVYKGLRLFGVRSKPLHKVLEGSIDPFIPGVTGSESDALAFLKEIGIEPKKRGKWKKITDLKKKEMKLLISSIIMKRIDEENPGDVLGNIYILPKEEKGSPSRDAREFATLLNSCGRMGKASLGIGSCLGNKDYLKKALHNMNSYRRELVTALKWYETEKRNKGSSLLEEGEGYVIINAQDYVMPTIAGTLASMIVKSSNFQTDTFVLCMAQQLDGNTKVSLRIARRQSDNEEPDLSDILGKVIKMTGGQSGGHRSAAGALIPSSKDLEFIKKIRLAFKEELLNESIA